jgi:hypothetical protein
MVIEAEAEEDNCGKADWMLSRLVVACTYQDFEALEARRSGLLDMETCPAKHVASDHGGLGLQDASISCQYDGTSIQDSVHMQQQDFMR